MSSAWAQNTLLQSDTLRAQGPDTLWLSQSFLVPFSEQIYTPSNRKLAASEYQIRYDGGWIRMLEPKPADSILIIQYRYFDPRPRPQISLRRLKLTLDTASQEQQVDVIYDERFQNQSKEFLATDRIRKSGSLSRGLTLGNNRGLSVNSGLRLQLEGDLGDGLKIVGAITDENIPIQPDGTTQQISDFDKVFIRLMKDEYSLTMGDYEVRRKGTRFGNYYRNVQGLQAARKGKQTQVQVSGAVAKGKFHTNTLQAREGVSGPYRLTGKNGERFFIVLAGSETVYLNGKRLQRGENLDYIINYNTAELTFTSKHVITNISRIVVDFEYNDQYYNRSLLVADLKHQLENDRITFDLSYARDADNPNAPFTDATAFGAARSTISQAGDNPLAALTSGIDLLEADDFRPAYFRKDTSIQGILYERYVFARDTSLDSANYTLRCSFVGQGNGFYQIDPTIQGAVVYEWVAPDSSGNPRGTHAPIRAWVLPRLLQVVNSRTEVQITDKMKLYNETAFSVEDKNRLSERDDDDNYGLALRTGLRWEKLKIKDSVLLESDVYYQYVGERYENLDRLYQAEYNRVWNLTDTDTRRNEQIVYAKMRLNIKNRLFLDAESGLRNTGIGRNAFRQVYRIQSQQNKGPQGNYQFTHIINQDDSLGRSANWFRHEGDVFVYLNKKLRLGTEIWIESKDESIFQERVAGSLAFTDLKPYLRTVNTKKFQLDASWNYRKDQEYLAGSLREKSLAYTWYLQGRYQPFPGFRVQSTSAYRSLKVLDSLFQSGLQDSRLLNTNFQMNFVPKNRLVTSNLIYEVNSEQLARQEVFFVEVNPGQGQYVWLDSLYNRDGIQDVEEFQLATIPEIANFIRVIRPTTELFPTTRLSLTGNIRWDLKNVMGDSKKILPVILRNTRAITNFRMSQNKDRNSNLASYFIDILDPFADSSLLNANYNLRQDVIFFQNNSTGDLRFSYLDNRTKLFLSTGDEFRSLQYYGATQRLNLNESRSIEIESRIGEKRLNSEGFANRNYDIFFWESHPRINVQFDQKARISAGYEVQYRRNTGLDSLIDARVQIHKLVFDGRYNIKDRNTVLAKLELGTLRQIGEPGTAALYELREGLQPGFNAVWQVLLTWYVLTNVELSFTYDGRASMVAAPIHTGRVQIRAFF